MKADFDCDRCVGTVGDGGLCVCVHESVCDNMRKEERSLHNYSSNVVQKRSFQAFKDLVCHMSRCMAVKLAWLTISGIKEV